MGRAGYAWLVAILAASVWTGLYLAQVLGSQFFADDFLYLQLARTGHLTPSWLAVNSYGHFAPITRLGYMVVERYADLHYPVAAIAPATLGAAIFLALIAIGWQLLGPRPATMLLALAGATSLPLLRVAQWWGSAMHVLGAALCMTACIAGFIALVRTGRRRYGAVSVGFLALGLLVQERPLLTIGYLVLIRYLFIPPAKPHSLNQLVRRETLLWLPYVLVLASYLTYRLFIFDAPPEPGNLHQGVVLTASGVERSFLPSVVGVRLGMDSGLLEPAAILGWLVLLGLGLSLLMLRRSAWKCAVFFAATYLANAALLAAGRLGVADAITQSRDLQYFVDPYLALVITLMLGFGALPARRRTRWPSEQALRLVGATVGLAIAIATATNWHSYVERNQQTAAHHFMNRALSGLSAQPGPFDLLHLTMPRLVAPHFLDPWTDEARIFSLSDGIERKLDPTSPRKLALLPTGAPQETSPVPLVTVRASPHTMYVGNEKTSLSATQRGACVTGTRGSALRIILPKPIHARGLFFQLTYSSTHPTSIIAAGQSGTDVSYNSGISTAPAGAHTIVDRLESTRAETMYLIFDTPVADFCVSSVRLVRIAVETPSGCRLIDHQGLVEERRADCTASWTE